jgi:hypothetical protein
MAIWGSSWTEVWIPIGSEVSLFFFFFPVFWIEFSGSVFQSRGRQLKGYGRAGRLVRISGRNIEFIPDLASSYILSSRRRYLFFNSFHLSLLDANTRTPWFSIILVTVALFSPCGFIIR